jgi:hypothetical protein
MKIFRIHLESRHHRIVDTFAERDGVSKAEAIRRMIGNHDATKDLSTQDGPRRSKKCTGIHLDEQHQQVLSELATRYNISRGEAARRIIASYRVGIVSSPAPPTPPPKRAVMGDAVAAH